MCHPLRLAVSYPDSAAAAAKSELRTPLRVARTPRRSARAIYSRPPPLGCPHPSHPSRRLLLSSVAGSPNPSSPSPPLFPASTAAPSTRSHPGDALGGEEDVGVVCSRAGVLSRPKKLAGVRRLDQAAPPLRASAPPRPRRGHRPC
jgi:hypothetical protein